MSYEGWCEVILVVLGGAYVLSKLTGDYRDASFVEIIRDIVKFVLRRQ